MVIGGPSRRGLTRARIPYIGKERIRAHNFFTAQVVKYQHITGVEEKKVKKLPNRLAKVLAHGIVCVLTERRVNTKPRPLKS